MASRAPDFRGEHQLYFAEKQFKTLVKHEELILSYIKYIGMLWWFGDFLSVSVGLDFLLVFVCGFHCFGFGLIFWCYFVFSPLSN